MTKRLASELQDPTDSTLQHPLLKPVFCVGAEDPNGGLHAYVAGRLPTDPSPQTKSY